MEIHYNKKIQNIELPVKYDISNNQFIKLNEYLLFDNILNKSNIYIDSHKFKDYNYFSKIIFLGDNQVGKTSFISSLFHTLTPFKNSNTSYIDYYNDKKTNNHINNSITFHDNKHLNMFMSGYSNFSSSNYNSSASISYSSSSLTNYLTSSYISTIGVESQNFIFEMSSNFLYKIQIWDTSGHKRFKNIMLPYLRNTNIFCIFFDKTNCETFENIDYWIQIISKIIDLDKVLIILIGTKKDKSLSESLSYGHKYKTITDNEIINKLKNYNALYYDCCAYIPRHSYLIMNDIIHYVYKSKNDNYYQLNNIDDNKNTNRSLITYLYDDYFSQLYNNKSKASSKNIENANKDIKNKEQVIKVNQDYDIYENSSKQYNNGLITEDIETGTIDTNKSDKGKLQIIEYSEEYNNRRLFFSRYCII
jgi:small GTP-binding protein